MRKSVSIWMLVVGVVFGALAPPVLAEPGAHYAVPKTTLSFADFTANGPDAEIISVVERCVREQGHPGKVEAICAGLITSACPDETGTTASTLACLEAEFRYWNKRMEVAGARLSFVLKQEDADADQDVYPVHLEILVAGGQMRWLAFADQWCAYEHARFRGGSLGRVTSASCRNNKTAYRAIELEQAIANHAPVNGE